MVTDSVVVFVVRDGNPKKIHSWNDLTKKGIEVITPNPFTSGGARWNVIAGYGAQRKLGKSHKQAVAWLTKLFHHVPVQPDSARAALTIFAQGKGDVLLTYENEAIYANKKGVHTDYIVPKQTILIENPVALTKTGVRHKEAKAFLTFLHSVKVQRIFGDTGYRPVPPSVAKEPRSLTGSPARPGCFHDRRARPRRLGQGREALVRREQRDHGQDRAGRLAAPPRPLQPLLAVISRISPRSPKSALPRPRDPHRPFSRRSSGCRFRSPLSSGARARTGGMPSGQP